MDSTHATTDDHIRATFVEDLKHELVRMLREAGYDMDPGELSAFEVATRYFAALRRRIAPRPRTVRRAACFSCPPDLNAGLAVVVRKAEQGTELGAHQTTRLLDTAFNDRLLNDWNIHHFHLGTEPHPSFPGFVQRTGPVLFARVTDTTFDLIDVRGHGTWHEQSLIQIVHENWPESLERHRVDPSVLSADTFSDDSAKKLRRAGLTYLLTMPDGTIYFAPGGGYQSSGVSTQAVTTADQWLDCAQAREDHVRAGFDDFCDRACAAGHEIRRPATIRLRLDAIGWYAEDEATGFRVEILRYSTQI